MVSNDEVGARKVRRLSCKYIMVAVKSFKMRLISTYSKMFDKWRSSFIIIKSS